MLLLLSLAVASVTLATANERDLYSPASSSYARVQYANKPNITRRFGTHRDPTIQYVSFDEMFNKPNKPKGPNSQGVPVILGSAQTSSVSTHEEEGGLLEGNEEPSDELPAAYDDEDLAVAGTHADNHSIVRAEDKMDSTNPNWDEVPDLTNGWTVERLNDVTLPKMTLAKPTSATPLTSKTKAKGNPTFNKGLDQVYAYSNAYQNYNEHFNKDSQVERDDWTTTKENPSATRKSTPLTGPQEYAHAIGDSADLHFSGNDVTTSPPVVMESSWTDKHLLSSPANPRPRPVLEDRVDSESTISEDLASVSVVKFPSQAERVGGNIGTQSAWRPFAGPTIPPTKPPRLSQSSLLKTSLATANIESSTSATNSADTLFYGEAQKAAFALKNRIPTEIPNQVPPGHPMFIVPDGHGRPPMHLGMPPHLLPTQHQLGTRPNELPNQQVLFISNVAENEVNRNNRPPGRGQNFPLQGPVMGNDGPGNVKFPSDMPQPTGQSPFVHPAPFMHNRQPFPRPQQQAAPPQFGLQNAPQQQAAPPQFGPQNAPQHLRPPQQNRFPAQVQQRPDLPRPEHAAGLLSDKPLNFGRPTSIGPNHVPSGPVSLPPQLLPNQGRPIAQPQGNTMTIHLPLPRPGPIGTSPDNPLPGPPIPLPGIPSGPIVIAGERPGNNKNDRPTNNGVERNPGFGANNFQLFNRHDGPMSGQDSHNNFVLPPQQGPFAQRNPNLPPNFHPQNFQLPPPPPPPPQKQQSSATSLIKTFLSRFFPFARSLNEEGVPIVDYDKFSNATNITELAMDPELLATFIQSAANSTDPFVINVESVDDDFLNTTIATPSLNQTEDVVSSTLLPTNMTSI